MGRHEFLSTLSLRRATNSRANYIERNKISIHALLAESDAHPVGIFVRVVEFLSTLSLRRATMFVNLRVLDGSFLSTLSLRRATLICPPHGIVLHISIHALLAESDFCLGTRVSGIVYFYPRSPCGERPWARGSRVTYVEFLSTLSLRRATHYDNYNLHCVEISIHALLAESDYHSRGLNKAETIFLSTLSLRRATT